MRTLRSTRRRIATAAAVIAVGGVATIGTASSASADVIKGTCQPNNSQIRIWLGSAYQCFSWNYAPPSVLNVNDWYDGVESGKYTIKVVWRDLSTGRDLPGILNPGQTSDQPTTNSVLWNITFES
ncbi:hypothetical protein ABIA35_008931 [Catenulispora sp. MAP12-49]|uniref:hypothetical protein n=1 Tax=unclassified Catenulispora TaxID=414885 RepID=UPI0035183EB7